MKISFDMLLHMSLTALQLKIILRENLSKYEDA